MGIPQEVRFAVAEMFWAYLKQKTAMPNTRTVLSKLYLDEFRPMLSNPSERRVNFGNVLYSLRKIGVIRWPRRKDKETIIYNAKGRKVPVRKNLAIKLREVSVARLDLAHLAEKLKKNIEKNRVDLARDKENISILPPSDKNGILDMGIARIGESKRVNLVVINKSNQTHRFACVTLGSTTDYNVENAGYEFLGKNFVNLVELAGNQSYNVTIPVTIDERFPGIFHVVVAFWFKCNFEDNPLHIVKFIKVDYRNDMVDELLPTEPYKKPELLQFGAVDELIKGEQLPTQNVDYKVELKPYFVPKRLRNEWESDKLENSMPTHINGSTPERRHCERLSVLLHVEELQMEEDIQRYNMETAKLKPISKTEYLALSVPGLAEKRPSLIRGDRLFVRKLKPDGTQEKKEYEGIVHDVERDEVHLKFNKTLHDLFLRNMSFAVRFTFSRTSLRLMHRALEQAPSYLQTIPFENKTPDINDVLTSPLCYYNRDIADNEEQKQAVENIVSGTSRPYPYLVFGPPGTGKTVTLVEAIQQVLFRFPNSKVLACAPSNSAADLILERVAVNNVVPDNQMVRLNAFGRSKKSVNLKVLDFCKPDGDFFYLPTQSEIKNYRLVVTTLITAGRLVSMGIGESHFTHLFIDEAGQGMEPECFVAVAGLLGSGGSSRGQLVLAGDPKQLGPVLRSPLAVRGGLGVSFLERLMAGKFSSYNRQHGGDPDVAGPYNAKMVTKLLKNYRSHPHIITVPNDLFYDGELQPCAKVVARESLCQWYDLPVKDFPVIFEGVNGKDEREKKSPSFFNPQEISAVLHYVKNLKDTKGNTVKNNDIGIISPYNQQVRKIREKLRNKPYDIRDVKVGSVEEFQGQERKVIIISTVRSSVEFLYFDASHKLGFLKNPKRFNVAITRAKALLIVVGNPHVLCRDPCWRRFIGFCQENGSYRGCAFEMPDIDDEYLSTQLEKLDLDKDTFLSRLLIDEEDPEWKPAEV